MKEGGLGDGDRVVTSKLTPRPFPLRRGDVIVFHDPAHWLDGHHEVFAGVPDPSDIGGGKGTAPSLRTQGKNQRTISAHGAVPERGKNG